MALDQEIWLGDLQKSLFADNEFLKFAKNDSAYATKKTIHIPQSGSAAGIEVNRSTIPATATARTDTDYTYDMDWYSVDPIRINHGETQYLSYDKRIDIIEQAVLSLRDEMGTQTFYKWAEDIAGSSAATVRTAGAASGSALPPSGTGTRLAMDVATLYTAIQTLAEQNIPVNDGNLWLGLPPGMYYQLITDAAVQNADAWGGKAVLPEGAINKIAGVNIYMRTTVNIYDTSAVIKAPGAAAAVTDNLGALLWHKSMVSVGQSPINVMTEDNSPIYYGDIMSADFFFGGKARRSDNFGMVEIVQA
jgi:hypothetical protein